MTRLLTALILFALAAGARAQTPNAGDEHVTGFDPRPAVEDVKQTIVEHGGDPDKQAVRVVLAFATGNAALDPARAHAMRFVAQQILNGLLVSGDTVRTAGFEMTPWLVSDERPFRPGERPAIWDTWPKTAAPQSVGGTDYNAALVGLLREVGGPGRSSNYVVLLLGPFESSVAPKGSAAQVLSDDSPGVTEAMQLAGCAPAKSYSFPYNQTNSTVQRAVWMHVYVPQRFSGPALAEHTRSEWLAGRSAWYPADDPYATIGVKGPPPAPAQKDDDTALWLTLIGAAVAIGVIAFLLMRRNPRAGSITLEITVEGRGKAAFAGPFGQGVVARIVGAGFPNAQSNDIQAGQVNDIPTLVLAEVHGAGRRVRVTPGSAAVSVDNQQATAAGIEISPGAARKVRLRGRHVPTDGRPTRDYDIALEVLVK
ncbi:MAG TPA: hypothetical protein VGM37_05910 [Armatimonadota bacterium]|jgi:hypothetical protein